MRNSPQNFPQTPKEVKKKKGKEQHNPYNFFIEEDDQVELGVLEKDCGLVEKCWKNIFLAIGGWKVFKKKNPMSKSILMKLSVFLSIQVHLLY